ncbi:MAG: hypothetical protein WCK27_28620 [Verrucomicrobiota bacterium]
MTTPPTPDRRGSWNLDSAVARVVLYTAVHPNPALAQRFPAQQPASSRSFSPTIIHSSTLHPAGPRLRRAVPAAAAP